MTEIAYAGMAAYRFTVPASAVSGSVPITSVELPIARDRFEKSGVHLAVALSNSATPTSDWAVVRGAGELAASSQLEQMGKANLMAGTPGDGVVTIDLSKVSGGNPAAYLWVYVTLEDYTARWTMYNAKEKRLYAVEGSAALVGGSAEVTFGGDVAADPASGTGMKYLVKPIPVHVTHYEGYHRTLRPQLCFTALSVAGGYEPLTSESANSLPEKSILLPVAKWTVPSGTHDLPLDYMLPTDGLRLPEGEYIIECWIDEAGDGKFAPGEPYGCTQKINLTASADPERMDIELTEVHPSIVRLDLAKVIVGMPSPSARPETQEGATPEPYPVSDDQFAVLAAATDRGRWTLPWATVEPTRYPGTDAPPDASLLTRVRIVRDMINGDESNTSAATLIDRYFELSKRAILTEADLFADGKIGLDWETLITSGWGGTGATLKNASYRIIVGNGDAGDQELGGNNLPIVFTNHFAGITYPTAATPDPAMVQFAYTGRPTFRWTHPNNIGKTYPAFVCVITTSNLPDGGSNVDSSTIVWRSGTMRAPARDAVGYYEFTAPIQAGTTVEQDGGGTFTFMPNTTYYWTVSMLDDLFASFSPRIAVLTPFSFAAN